MLGRCSRLAERRERYVFWLNKSKGTRVRKLRGIVEAFAAVNQELQGIIRCAGSNRCPAQNATDNLENKPNSQASKERFKPQTDASRWEYYPSQRRTGNATVQHFAMRRIRRQESHYLFKTG